MSEGAGALPFDASPGDTRADAVGFLLLKLRDPTQTQDVGGSYVPEVDLHHEIGSPGERDGTLGGRGNRLTKSCRMMDLHVTKLPDKGPGEPVVAFDQASGVYIDHLSVPDQRASSHPGVVNGTR